MHSTSNLQSFQSLSPKWQNSLLYARASLFPFCRRLLTVPAFLSVSGGTELSVGEAGRAQELLLPLGAAGSTSCLTLYPWLRATQRALLGDGHACPLDKLG